MNKILTLDQAKNVVIEFNNQTNFENQIKCLQKYNEYVNIVIDIDDYFITFNTKCLSDVFSDILCEDGYIFNDFHEIRDLASLYGVTKLLKCLNVETVLK